MSYDLYFRVPAGCEPLSKRDFQEYFERREWYTVQENQAFYENEDTGVYFSFEYDENPEDAGLEADQAGSAMRSARVSFNINYYRPSIFALEAEPEISAFVRRFSLLVEDPQLEGMGQGEYTSEGFLCGWNAGNLFAVGTIACHKDENQRDEPPVLPRDEILRCWRWNKGRRHLQEAMTEDIFVPKISFCSYEGRPRSYVVWGDAVPIVLPRVELVILFRKDLAPKRLFGRRQDLVLVTYAEAVRFFPAKEKGEPGLEYRVLYYTRPPEEIAEFFRRQKAFTKTDFGLGIDRILEAETLAEAKRKADGMETIEF